jgi:hypothetical protein
MLIDCCDGKNTIKVVSQSSRFRVEDASTARPTSMVLSILERTWLYMDLMPLDRHQDGMQGD